jgi:hypothetical protein
MGHHQVLSVTHHLLLNYNAIFMSAMIITRGKPEKLDGKYLL